MGRWLWNILDLVAGSVSRLQRLTPSRTSLNDFAATSAVSEAGLALGSPRLYQRIPARQPMPARITKIGLDHSPVLERGEVAFGIATGRVWSAPHNGQTRVPCSLMAKHDQQDAPLYTFVPMLA